MTVKRARLVFAVLMQAAREGKHFTQYDKQQLTIARQTLRQIRKPVSNPKSNESKDLKDAKEIAKRYGHRIRYNIEYGEYIITGPFFPTGYHADMLDDIVGTLMYEVKRHNKKGSKNPKATLIYGTVNRIIATKTQKHICDAECKRHGHRYYHDFASKPQMYGLPDGSLLIKSR